MGRETNFIIRIVLLVSVCVSVSCLQTQNSSSQDKTSYGPASVLGVTAAVTSVLSTNCAACHAAENFHLQTSGQLIANGYVVAGNPEASKLYYRLTGSTGSLGPKTMPMGSALTSDDLESIRSWIQDL